MDFAYWRLLHVILGVVIAALLLMHTGFRLGDNINFYLMSTFCGLLLVGAVAGVVISLEHRMPGVVAKQIRTFATWSHIVLLWPIPALLGFHILKTFYF